MLSSELNKMLVSKFPNLQEKYLEEVSWQEGDDTGSHVVYGDVLTPYLKECITNENRQEFQAIFDFLEHLLRLDDEYADNIVFCSVLESIAYLVKEKPSFISSLGEKCKKALSEVQIGTISKS